MNGTNRMPELLAGDNEIQKAQHESEKVKWFKKNGWAEKITVSTIFEQVMMHLIKISVNYSHFATKIVFSDKRSYT